jgi:hypothetical protein
VTKVIVAHFRLSYPEYVMSELINNREARIQTLKGIIRHLHSGKPADEVRNQLKELVGQTDYSEVAAMEQQLIAEGMPVEEIASMCDLHSQVTRDVLVQLPARAVEPGHPLDTMRRENEALADAIWRMRGAMTAVAEGHEEQWAAALMQWRQAANDLHDVDKHYQRKEHCFFPHLEAHGITGPSKVMWAKDDEVRAMLKDLSRALRQQDAIREDWAMVAQTLGAAAAAAIEEMIYKENQILLPMCENAFTAEEWADVWLASPRYGWCLVEPRDSYRPPESVVEKGLALPRNEGVQLPTGNLKLAQMVALFNVLPVDLTFVDADDRVAFFSEGPDRVFARSRAILGRKVQHCHPPRSVDVVDRIVSDFREGRQNVAEFWIEFHGRFVHIRYFAVRDEDGTYLGTLEVTQDLTKLRALTGERRLLEYAGQPAQ